MIPGYIEKTGNIFVSVPDFVEAAFLAHKPYVCRKLKTGEAELYLDTLFALQRACRKASRAPGYFVVGDFLFGYGGEPWDRKWVVLDRSKDSSDKGE